MADKTMPGPKAVPGYDPHPAGSSYGEKKALKQKAAQQALGIANVAQQNVGSLAAAQKAGMRDIVGQSAEGLGAGQAASGRMGGSAYGAALQAGKDAGLSQAQFGYQSEGAMADARTQAAQAALSATQYQRDLGTDAEDTAAEMADITTAIANAAAPFKGAWYESDSRDQAADAVLQLLSTTDNPVIQEEIRRQAALIASGARDI